MRFLTNQHFKRCLFILVFGLFVWASPVFAEITIQEVGSKKIHKLKYLHYGASKTVFRIVGGKNDQVLGIIDDRGVDLNGLYPPIKAQKSLLKELGVLEKVKGLGLPTINILSGPIKFHKPVNYSDDFVGESYYYGYIMQFYDDENNEYTFFKRGDLENTVKKWLVNSKKDTIFFYRLYIDLWLTSRILENYTLQDWQGVIDNEGRILIADPQNLGLTKDYLSLLPWVVGEGRGSPVPTVKRVMKLIENKIPKITTVSSVTRAYLDAYTSKLKLGGPQLNQWNKADKAVKKFQSTGLKAKQLIVAMDEIQVFKDLIKYTPSKKEWKKWKKRQKRKK
ncbi:MAG: hypothetical protein GY754_45510 [bacterium]|nr:hypothetical protein [bacterium]